MASTHSVTQPSSFVALDSFMSHFDPRPPSPSAPDAPASDPTDSSDPMAGYRELEARVRAEAREAQRVRARDETPELRRAMAVVASEYPQTTCRYRQIYVRAVMTLGERDVMTDFDRRVRAAYAGGALETTPSGLINPSPMDWTALWLSAQLPGAAMSVYRALVTKTLLHVRLRAPLSPEQTRLYRVYRKAQSELGASHE